MHWNELDVFYEKNIFKENYFRQKPEEFFDISVNISIL
jgi:hypothetical protein